MITVQEIKYFQEVAKQGHISRASERLGVSQPTLSYAVKKIEETLGVELFIRSKKGVELTLSGERLLLESKNLDLAWQKLHQAVYRETHEPEGLIRLGCHSSVAKYTLPNILPTLLKNNPKIDLKLEHGLSRHMTEMVVSSRLDVAIAVNPLAHEDLIIQEVCTDIVTLFKPKKCLNNDLLILHPDLLQTQDILKKLNQKKMNFRKVLESSSLDVIAELLAAGLGHAILPTRVVNSMRVKSISPVKKAPLFKDKICLLYKHEFRKAKRGQAFINTATSFVY